MTPRDVAVSQIRAVSREAVRVKNGEKLRRHENTKFFYQLFFVVSWFRVVGSLTGPSFFLLVRPREIRFLTLEQSLPPALARLLLHAIERDQLSSETHQEEA